LKGVLVHAMGPSHDPEVIRDMDPPKGGAYEIAAASSNGDTALHPFDDRFVMASALVDAFLSDASISQRELKAITTIAEEDPLALAVQLDKAVNGTSLMLMFEMSGALLLFPGDARGAHGKQHCTTTNGARCSNERASTKSATTAATTQHRESS
jgi:hypothetical protein